MRPTAPSSVPAGSADLRPGSGTWLCPTPFDRARLVDMEARLGPARAVMYGALGLAFLAVVPWQGLWPLIPLAAVILFYRILRPVMRRSRRPEIPVAATVVYGQAMLGIGIALTGGPQSPAIALLLLPIVTLPARFGARGVFAGLVTTEIVLLAATLGVDPAGFAAHPEGVILGTAAAAGLAGFASALMRAEVQQRTDAWVDQLTGLANRKALDVGFELLCAQARHDQTTVSMIVCDLDHFKAVNDTHGHDRGDDVLRVTAVELRRRVRPSDGVYRIGGEEFVIVLPGIELDGAVVIAERMRAGIKAARPAGVDLTASMGVSAATGDALGFDLLFRAADCALYDAKRAGRDAVGVTPGTVIVG